MAVTARHIQITRHHVRAWIAGWNISVSQGGTLTLPQWIRAKVDALNLADPYVNTEGHDTLDDQTHVAEMIIMDLRSYDNAPGS